MAFCWTFCGPVMGWRVLWFMGIGGQGPGELGARCTPVFRNTLRRW